MFCKLSNKNLDLFRKKNIMNLIINFCINFFLLLQCIVDKFFEKDSFCFVEVVYMKMSIVFYSKVDML